MKKIFSLALALSMFGLYAAYAADWYVSPAGSSTANGSINQPWALQTALNGGYPSGVVRPGDTIWLRGGTYRGMFGSSLTGTASAPIIVRGYPGEWAKVDGGITNKETIFAAVGGYTWFWGFEIFTTGQQRWSNQSVWNPTDIFIGPATTPFRKGIKFINMVTHDTAGNFVWQEAEDVEYYGCLIYNEGWDAPDRGHGHGFYIKSMTGPQKYIDNIVWGGFENGFQVYADDPPNGVNNITLEGNTVFLHTHASGQEIMIGSGSTNNPTNFAQNPTVLNNYVYGSLVDIGYLEGGAAGFTNLKMDNNYMVLLFGKKNGLTFNRGTIVSFKNNTIVADSVGSNVPTNDPSNSFYTSAKKPVVTKIFIRPNKYESGRAHITVFNWGGNNTVNVDLSGVLNDGDPFVIKDAQNFFGPALVNGTYRKAERAGMVEIPMNSTAVAQIDGVLGQSDCRATHTSSEFGVFVLRKTGGSTITYGDVSGDGKVSAYDAALVGQYVVGSVTFTSEQITRADVSGGGGVSAYDAALIAQYAVGLITKFPVEG